jgi:hypothetical protein
MAFYHKQSNFHKFCVNCVICGQATSKAYARNNQGKCKSCVTGVERDISKHPLLCPDCQEHLLTPYQKANRYHCDHCTREADPEGYRREVMGYNDGPSD